MSVKIRDFVVAENIMTIVDREVSRILSLVDPDDRDIARLERMAKTYSVLMASTRENIKHGLYGNLSGADLGDEVFDGTEEAPEDAG